MKLYVFILAFLFMGVGCQGTLAPKEIKQCVYAAELDAAYMYEQLKDTNPDAAKGYKRVKETLAPAIHWFRGEK